MPMPDYKHYLAIYQRRHNIDYIQKIKESLTAQIVLDRAQYSEGNDRQFYGHIINQVDQQQNLGVRANHIDQSLDVYSDGQNGKDFHKSRAYLRILAAHLPRATIDERAWVAGLFGHGGA